MMAAGPRNFPNNLLTRLHGAFSTSVTPPKLEINRKTIEKTWKLMDKVVLIDVQAWSSYRHFSVA